MPTYISNVNELRDQTCNYFLGGLNRLPFGALSNFDFINITMFCKGIYYKSPFKFFNYLFSAS